MFAVRDDLNPGFQVLCFAGAGILDLGKELEAIHRESHSVLGSIFLNPSVAAGVAFGSGGTQLHKGPAYTERALYCRVTADGEVELVNELGVRSNSTAELLAKLQSKDLSDADLDPACKRKVRCCQCVLGSLHLQDRVVHDRMEHAQVWPELWMFTLLSAYCPCNLRCPRTRPIHR